MHEPLIIGKVGVLLVGLFISYQAYRGYRRNQSPAMLYLGVGFALISVGTAIEGVLFEVFEIDIFLAGTVQTVVSGAGMLVILYSLYGNHGRSID